MIMIIQSSDDNHNSNNTVRTVNQGRVPCPGCSYYIYERSSPRVAQAYNSHIHSSPRRHDPKIRSFVCHRIDVSYSKFTPTRQRMAARQMLVGVG